MPPLFLGRACVPRNISQGPKLHWNNEKHLCTNHILLLRAILYIGHIIWFCSTCWLQFGFVPLIHLVWVRQAWVHIISAVNSWNTNLKHSHTCKLLWMHKMTKLLLSQLVTAIPGLDDGQITLATLLFVFTLFSMHLGLCKCPTTSFLTTNLGLNKLGNLNSRSSNPTSQISINGI